MKASFDTRYQGRPVLVTGSSAGIGASVACLLHDAGAHVIGCSRHPSQHDFMEIRADVASQSDVLRLMAEVRRAHGCLDLVVHCAGILGPRRPLLEVDLAEFDDVMRINVVGSFLIAKHAHPLLALGRAPLLGLLSSSVGRRGRATWGPYGVSKHGVEGLATTLAEEWRDDEIGVWSINPGGTATRMRAEAMPQEDPSTLPTADDVARVILERCAGFQLAQTGTSWDVRDYAAS